MSDRTPLTDLETAIAAKLATARFPSYSASKRFARDLGDGHVKALSSKGRRFLAYVVNRFRRQYALSSEEKAWVNEWINWQDESKPAAAPLIACRAPEPVPDPQLEMFR
jgi:hypothetical protein